MDIYYLNNFSNLSPIISIVLFLGLYQFGSILDRTLKINNFIISKNIWAHYPIISIIFILAFLSPFLYLKILDPVFIKLTAYILFFSGFYLIYSFMRNFFLHDAINIFKGNDIYYYIFLIFILNFFLISLSPITHADALDYHAPGSQYIINNGKLPTNPLWFHGKLVGLGELFSSIGFIVGAEQFGSLVQFSTIFSIVQTFFDIKNKKINKNFYLLLIVILSSPLMIYFISTAKPHFFQSAFFLLTLKILIFDIRQISKKKVINLFLFFLTGSIIFMNIKFSSILSSCIILTYFIFIILQKRLLSFKLIFYSLVIIFITLIPKLYFYYLEYETGFVTTLIFSLPVNLVEFDKFYFDLKEIHNSGNIFKSLFIPRNLAELSTILGVGPILYLAINKFDMKKKLIISMCTIYVLIAYLFGPKQARFYIDPYLWLFLCTINIDFTKNYLNKTFLFFGKIQVLIFLAILFYSSSLLSYGSLNSNLKDQVLSNNANGYELFQWVNDKLPVSSVLLSSHRSIGFSKNKVISTDYRRYLKDNKKISKYLLKNNITHVLFYGLDQNSIFYKKCLGNMIAYKKKVGKHVVRNLFHKKQKQYDAWIYEFDIKKKPNCIN